MTKKKPRYYSVDFKREAVLLVINGDRLLREVAADLGITPKRLSHWKRQYERQEKWACPADAIEDEGSEVSRLRDEVARLRQENHLLKKASAYFARQMK